VCPEMFQARVGGRPPPDPPPRTPMAMTYMGETSAQLEQEFQKVFRKYMKKHC